MQRWLESYSYDVGLYQAIGETEDFGLLKLAMGVKTFR